MLLLGTTSFYTLLFKTSIYIYNYMYIYIYIYIYVFLPVQQGAHLKNAMRMLTMMMYWKNM